MKQLIVDTLTFFASIGDFDLVDVYMLPLNECNTSYIKHVISQ